MKLTIDGTAGAAVVIARLLKAEIESGVVRVNYGSWTTPIIVEAEDETAEALADLLLEAGCRWVNRT